MNSARLRRRFSLVMPAQLEFGTLVLLQPQRISLLPSGPHPEHDVHGLVARHSFIADLDPCGIEQSRRVDRFERACCQSTISSSAVSVTAPIRSGDTSMPSRAQMADDLTGAHTAGAHRNDFVVEPRKRGWYLPISRGSKRA